jgi:DNA-binding transcriptional LysR family regulator
MTATFDLDALRTMVVGTDLGSFARAASQIGRSQSAVSMQLKKLEQQTGHRLFRRSGRGLVPTEAGEALLAYARRILALNDEAAAALGAKIPAASVRLGLPQDLFEDVMTETIVRFSRRNPGVHVEVRAGRNYSLEREVDANRIDVAIAFFPLGADPVGETLTTLPMQWLAGRGMAKLAKDEPLPLVLFDHPCLFRQTALRALDGDSRAWRLSLTTPSLPGVWEALRAGYGVSVRPATPIPAGIREIGLKLGLPKLPRIELRMLTAKDLSPAAADLRDIVSDVVHRRPKG